ncbi:MAG: amidase [Bradymonadaceae bacterium]
MLLLEKLSSELHLPRLKGDVLRRVRQLVGREPFRSIARRQVEKTFRLDELLELPHEARDAFDESPRPHQGADAHGWASAGHIPPDPDDGRVTAVDLRARFRTGDLTPVDVVERLDERRRKETFGNATHDPFTAWALERAREAAEASTERYAAGQTLGPLDGIPVGIKDHHDVEGLRTNCGTTYYGAVDGPADADSYAVQQLREAGAVVVGKTHTTEWGLQPTGFSGHHSMPRNLYDEELAAGGSSTGTAAAVGLGLIPSGLGSDGGGSIRIPAALNGLFGLKPTYQRIGRTGDHWRFSTVSHNGPIGQSARDLVDFLTAASLPPDPDDRATAYAPDAGSAAEDWRRALGRGVEDCRIGIWKWAFEVADGEIAEECRKALRALEAEGAELVDVSIDYSQFHQGIGSLIIGVEDVGFLDEVFERFGAQSGNDLRLILEVLSTIDAREYMLARRTRAVIRRKVARAFRDVDLLASPTVNCPPPDYPLEDEGDDIYDERAIHDLCRFSFLANLTGIPAASVPIGRAYDSPTGLQLMADAWDEASLLAATAHCERLGLTENDRPEGYETF